MNKRKRIFWAGDSTVATNKIDTYPQTGIGQVLYLYLKDNIDVYNYAKNGRSSKSFINEGILDEINKNIQEDDFLFIEFGHNDEKENDELHTEAFSSYQDYLMKYVSVAREKGAYPVFITSLYRRWFDDDGHIKSRVHLDYPDAMIELSKKQGIPVIDLCNKSKELLENMGDENSKNLYMNINKGQYKNYEDGQIDNSHLKYNGAVIMAGLIADGLKKLGGKYKELLL